MKVFLSIILTILAVCFIGFLVIAIASMVNDTTICSQWDTWFTTVNNFFLGL